MGSSSDFGKEMDDRLIKEPRGYWAFAPSILPQKSHGNAPKTGLEMDMANEELVKKVKELLKTDADLGFLLVLKRKEKIWRSWWLVSGEKRKRS